MSNVREMTQQWLQKKILNFQNMNILYIALKHVIWRFRTCNYFREIFRFRDFMDTLRNFAKSVFAHISTKFNYSAKQLMLTESPDHIYKMIYNMFIFLKSEIFSGAIAESFRENCSQSREIKIFWRCLKWIGLFDKFPFQWYIVCWGKFRLSKIIGGGGGGGGRPAPPPSLILQMCVCHAYPKTYKFYPIPHMMTFLP